LECDGQVHQFRWIFDHAICEAQPTIASDAATSIMLIIVVMFLFMFRFFLSLLH
jgi:hypothetical protein